MTKLLTMALAVMGVGLLSACSPSPQKPSASSASAPAITSVPGQVWTSKPAPQFTPDPAPAAAAPVECLPAGDALVAQIEGQLGGDLTLVDAFRADGPEGYVYVGGNIMDGENKVSSSDVWVARDGFIAYALSGTARELTPQLADGRDLGLSAGDNVGSNLQACIQVSERTRNVGGN